MIRLTLAATFIASAALATPWSIPDGHGGWTDNPACHSDECHATGVPDPIKPPVVTQGGQSSNGPTTEQHYGFCCIVDGQTRYHTAFGRDDATARKQCQERKLPPVCNSWITEMVRGLK